MRTCSWRSGESEGSDAGEPLETDAAVETVRLLGESEGVREGRRDEVRRGCARRR